MGAAGLAAKAPVVRIHWLKVPYLNGRCIGPIRPVRIPADRRFGFAQPTAAPEEALPRHPAKPEQNGY